MTAYSISHESRGDCVEYWNSGRKLTFTEHRASGRIWVAVADLEHWWLPTSESGSSIQGPTLSAAEQKEAQQHIAEYLAAVYGVVSSSVHFYTKKSSVTAEYRSMDGRLTLVCEREESTDGEVVGWRNDRYSCRSQSGNWSLGRDFEEAPRWSTATPSLVALSKIPKVTGGGYLLSVYEFPDPKKYRIAHITLKLRGVSIVSFESSGIVIAYRSIFGWKRNRTIDLNSFVFEDEPNDFDVHDY